MSVLTRTVVCARCRGQLEVGEAELVDEKGRGQIRTAPYRPIENESAALSSL